MMVANAAQKTLSAEDLFGLAFLNGGVLSPDGTQVLYVVLQVINDEEKNAVWWHSLITGATRQMTADGYNPTWSPAGDAFAFISARDECPQLYVMPIDGGEARQLTTVKQGVEGGPAWSPDGKTIAFTAGPAVAEPFDFDQPYRITRCVYRFDNIGYLDQTVQDIYIVSAEGGEARQLTNDETMNTNPIWSPDGGAILYEVTMRPDRFNAIRPVLRIVDLAGHSHDLLGDWGHVLGANWTPDGQRIVFVGQPAGLPIGSKNDVFVVDRGGGTPQNRTPSLKFDPGGPLQADMPCGKMTRALRIFCDDQQAYVRVQCGGTYAIYRVSLDGVEDYEPLVSGERACYPLDMAGDKLLYGVSTLNDPTQLDVADLDGRNEQQLTNLNDDFLADFALPEIEHLTFSGVDGVAVEGWYLKPPQGTAPYPTILYIHGGPHAAYGHVFSFDFQMLVGAGYGVLIVNHRASTGYGDAFATAIKGDWGNLDYHDLMAGVDQAIAQGLADPDQLGVCGLSGGGNLSSWIIGQTNRFKAAIPENPVTNWVSFYGVSDIGVWFAVEQLGGHPHEIPDVYARCSPITYAHRCVTPTLLVQGEQDYRCPAEQSEQFYAVLKANGCAVEMLRLPNSSHGGAIIGPIANRRAQNAAMLHWFGRYLPVNS